MDLVSNDTFARLLWAGPKYSRERPHLPRTVTNAGVALLEVHAYEP